jgi:hypothetical protein
MGPDDDTASRVETREPNMSKRVAVAAVIAAIVVSIASAFVVIASAPAQPPHMRHLILASRA